MLSFRTIPDSMGHPSPTSIISDSRHVLVLADGGSAEVTVPVGSRRIVINATGDIWVQYNAPALVPSTSLLSGNAPELNPSMRSLDGITSVGVAAATACQVSICFFG